LASKKNRPEDSPEDAPETRGEEPSSEPDIHEQLEEALREKEQFRAMAQRAQADLVNYKRRAAEEQQEVRRAANTQLLLGLLSLADDLKRALEMVPDDAVAPGWLDGLRLVERNLVNLLDASGVTKMEAKGQPFEPWEHEAVLHEEAPNGQEGTVVRVIRDGYKLYDRVLRAAQVSVAKAPEPEHEPDSSEQKE